MVHRIRLILGIFRLTVICLQHDRVNIELKSINYAQPIDVLTHWGVVTQTCVREPRYDWFPYYLIGCSSPSHYLNQWLFTAYWTHDNTFRWNIMHNNKIFFKKTLQNVVGEMSAIMCRSQLCVDVSTNSSQWFILHWMLSWYSLPDLKHCVIIGLIHC